MMLSYNVATVQGCTVHTNRTSSTFTNTKLSDNPTYSQRQRTHQTKVILETADAVLKGVFTSGVHGSPSKPRATSSAVAVGRPRNLF